MYEIYMDDKNLYYPGDAINAVMEARVSEELNSTGSMNITVPLTNPLYDKIYERKTTIEVRKSGEYVWGGEVRNIGQNMKKDKKLYIIGDMSYLQDSIQPRRKYSNVAPVQLIKTLVALHNEQVEDRKKFTVGRVTIDVPSGILNISTNREDTLSVIRDKICREYNGYIKIRKMEGIKYVDVVRIEDYGKKCEQPIQFGRNLLDYAKNLTADEIATAVIPLGKQLEETEDELESYVDITSVNGGLDYIYNETAVESFGWVKRVARFNDVTDPQELLAKGKEWLSQNQYSKLIIEVKAVDLSDVDINMDTFVLGDNVNAQASPFGLDAWYYIRKKDTDILNKAQNMITIGNAVAEGFTKQTNSQIVKVEKNITQTAIKTLENAKLNASNLIKSATNGNIYLVNDDNGNPKELLIMDSKDIETAKHVWRWNINGLGYSSTGYNGEFGLAMTMDGSIVADFITTGTLSANIVKTGKLELTDDRGTMIKIDYDNKEVWVRADKLDVAGIINSNTFKGAAITVQALFATEGITVDEHPCTWQEVVTADGAKAYCLGYRS